MACYINFLWFYIQSVQYLIWTPKIGVSDYMGFQGIYLLLDLDTEESTEEYDGNQCDFVTHIVNNRIQFIFLSVSSPIS